MTVTETDPIPTETGCFVFKIALAGAVERERGSNPQLQPWEGDDPFLYSGAPDKPLKTSIHPHFRARARGLRQSISADQWAWTLAI